MVSSQKGQQIRMRVPPGDVARPRDPGQCALDGSGSERQIGTNRNDQGQSNRKMLYEFAFGFFAKTSILC
jgi:hypothetical protein